MLQGWRSFPFGWDTGNLGLLIVNIIMMLEFLRKIRWEQPSLSASTYLIFPKTWLPEDFFFSLCDPCAVGNDLLATPSAIWSLNEQPVKQFLCFNVILMIVVAALKAKVKSSWILHKAELLRFPVPQISPWEGSSSPHPWSHELHLIQCCNRCTFTLQPKLL